MSSIESLFTDEGQLARAIIETAQTVVLVLDRDGRIVQFNPYLEAISGYTLEEMQGADWFEAFLPECDRERTRKLFRTAVGERPTRGNVNPIVTKDGRLRQIEWHDTTLKDEAGRVVGLLAVGQDVTERIAAETALRRSKEELESRVAERTEQLSRLNRRLIEEIEERKRSEAALKASQRRLQTVVSKAPLILFSLDRDGVFTFSDGKALEKLGLEPGQAVGLSALDLYADVPEGVAALKRALRGEEFSTILRGHGLAFHAAYTPLHDDDGAVAGTIGVATDITERIATEQALAASERKHRLLVENSPYCIHVLDRDKRFVSINRTGLALLGIQHESQAVGLAYLDFVAPSDRQFVEARLASVFRGHPAQFEFRTAKGGRMQSSVVPLPEEDGRIDRVMGMNADITERFAAEEKLRRSERQLVDAQRIARLGNWNWDIEDNELTWSDEIYRIFGLRPQQFEATYEAFLRRVHPDDRDLVQHAVLEALEQEKPYSLDHRIVLPSGEVRIVHEQAEVEFSRDRRPVRMSGTVQDITQRKRDEQSLALAAELMEHMAEGVNLIRLQDQTIVFANPRFETMFGYEPGELVGRHVSVLNASAENTPEETARRIFAAVEQFGVWSGEIHNVRKDGAEFWTSATISRFHHGEHGEVLITVQQDITQSKHIEEQLRRNEAKFRKHFENNPIPIYCWQKYGDDFLLVDYNPAAAESTGDNVENLRAARLSQVYADMPDVLEDFRATVETGRPVVRDMEYVFRTTGETRSFRVRYIHVSPDMVMVHTEDRTNERRMEEEARVRQEQLAHVARLVTIGEMASGIAHEINQPLTSITAFSDSCAVLCDRWEEPAAQRQMTEMLAKISEQSRRAGAIIHRVLQLSRRSRPHRTPVDLNALVDRSFSFLAHDERLKQIAVERRYAARLPAVHVDPVQIEQVLLNLLRNALDAMGASDRTGSRLVLSTQDLGDGTVAVAVRDSGRGIPEHEIESVFEAFLTSKQAGLGLGLAISRSIVEAHHGRLEVHPNPDQGVTFKVVLPINAATADEDTA